MNKANMHKELEQWSQAVKDYSERIALGSDTDRMMGHGALAGTAECHDTREFGRRRREICAEYSLMLRLARGSLLQSRYIAGGDWGCSGHRRLHGGLWPRHQPGVRAWRRARRRSNA